MDRHAGAAADLQRAVLDTPGATDEPTRRAAFAGQDVPEPLAAYLGAVREASYRVTDADVAGLVAAGVSEDAVFELTVAAALGAARLRLDAGLRALGEGG